MNMEQKLNNSLLGVAVGLLVVGFAVWGIQSCARDEAPEPPEPAELRLVAQDIKMDVRDYQVSAGDFVAHVHGDGPFKFELMVTDEADPYWEREDHFDCEDLGENVYWVRVQKDAYEHGSPPVRVLLTIGDGDGMCGDPQFHPGSN